MPEVSNKVSEGAGEVVAVGEGVTDPEPGAHVIDVGIASGAFAEYMILPTAGAARVPEGWSDEHALGLGLTGREGVDLVLEWVSGATFDASLAATKRAAG